MSAQSRANVGASAEWDEMTSIQRSVLASRRQQTTTRPHLAATNASNTLSAANASLSPLSGAYSVLPRLRARSDTPTAIAQISLTLPPSGQLLNKKFHSKALKFDSSSPHSIHHLLPPPHLLSSCATFAILCSLSAPGRSPTKVGRARYLYSKVLMLYRVQLAASTR